MDTERMETITLFRISDSGLDFISIRNPQSAIRNWQSLRGFTLVELLVAATMISVMIVGLAGPLQGAVGVWRRASQTAEALQQKENALDRLARDLANAFVYDGQGEASPQIEFGRDHARWITLQSAAVGETASVRFVSYQCSQTQTEEATQGDVWLWRTSQSIAEVLAQHQAQPQRLLPRCEALSFRYAYLPAEETAPLDWHSDWVYAPQLPRFVEVTIELAGATQIRHRLSIPVGSLNTFEESSEP